MDLAKSISYNGWTAAALTPTPGGAAQSGYIVEQVDLSNVPAVGYFERRALQDGANASDVFLGQRQVRVVVGVYGSTKGDYWDKAQNFLAAFTPTLAYSADTAERGFLPFKFFQPTAITGTWSTASFPNGIPLQMNLRPSALPTFEIRRDETGGVSGKGLSGRFTATLVARDPRKYLQTEQSLAITLSNATATHRGDYPVLPVITVALSASGASNLFLTVNSQSIVINLSSQSSGTFTVDFSDRTLTDSNGDLQAGLITSVQSWQSIQPGGTIYSATNTTGISALTLSYREAFV